MPADIEQMFSVREVPWHRQGEVLGDYPQTFAEARVLAGLDWDPVAYPVTADVIMTAAQFRDRAAELLIREPAELPTLALADKLTRLWQESFQGGRDAPVPDLTTLAGAVAVHEDMIAGSEWNRIARSDTGATLSFQRTSYTIIPNSAFGEIIDSVIGAEKDTTVRLETGGCLAGGRKVWMLARLDEPMTISARGRTDSSLTFPFLGITSSHDGKASCAARLTAVRIVCANTFAAAEAEGDRTGAVYAFSHRGDWRERIGEAREALQFARNEARVYAEAMSDLLGITVTPEQEKRWLAEFIPTPPDALVSERVMRNIEDSRAAIQGFLDGVTVEGAGIRGTAYGLVQAAGEYLDHVRAARTWESKLNRSLLRIEPLKAKAAELAREAARA